jgi:RNA polymerase sigma-70 factor (ECF subfamily)
MPRDELIALIPRLRRYARLLTGDSTLADDLVQDTLARACEKWHLFRPGTDLRAWLFTLMHHLNASHWKARAHQPVEADDVVARAPDSIDDTARHRDDALDLQRAFAVLAPEHRQVLLLVCVEDLSYAETAEVIGVPIGTVMSRLSRARLALRERLHAPHAPVPARPFLRVLK